VTATDTTPRTRPLPLALVGLLRDLVVGGLLCLSPLTSLIALGWLTRRMQATVAKARGVDLPRPGWIMGPRGQGRIARILGGLGANIRTGVMTLAGLGALTLPFSAFWLGAWWAGWENSFNKGYEQAAIGPGVWLAATLLALVVLAHLPFALAHAASEGRLAAFFALRRIRAIAAAAGWRGPWLGLLTVVLSLPLLGARALPALIEEIVPGFADMPPDHQMQVADTVALLTAFYTFAAVYILRGRAAVLYARATARLAAAQRPVSRLSALVWPLLSGVIALGLVFQILSGQFMNYDPRLWLTHPAFLLPWSP
jgi:hypothetical protein